jgi:hypothetical protein
MEGMADGVDSGGGGAPQVNGTCSVGFSGNGIGMAS